MQTAQATEPTRQRMPLQDATVLILAQLGLKCPQSSVAEATQGFRIEFDNQFFVELHAISPDICRVSSRISRLAKSLETQNRQIEKALSLQQDLGERTPRNVALAISGHDNCLRSVLDLEGGACFADGQVQEEITENLMRQFQAFVHYAYALKSTFVNAAT